MRGKTAATEACWVTKMAVKPKNVPILGDFGSFEPDCTVSAHVRT